jgi:hypothetical protein
MTTENPALIETLEHLSSAWTNCGERPGIVADCLDSFDLTADLIADNAALTANLRATIDARCPGLLAAAEVYGRHIEAGQPDFDDPRFIRRLFTAHMGRDPFGQPSTEPA